MNMQIELLLLILSILFFVSILADKAGSRWGVPSLLFFLGVGMLFGSDGFGFNYENITISTSVGTVALCIILFSGGMDTKMSDIRPVLSQGLLLATVGVLLTAAVTGFATWWIFGKTHVSVGLGLVTALLLAATMSSTDSASVFSILRSKGLHLKNNLRPMLELESGSNDPMAYILTITLIDILKVSDGAMPNVFQTILFVLMQLVIGAAMGYLLGKLLVWGINKLNIDNASLFPILIFTCCIFIFSFTYFLKGNGYLAVYIGGLVIGNSRVVHKRSTMKFFDGLSWLSQLLMFLLLGLLVKPHELVPVIVPGLIISFLMIFVSRPLGVFVTLLPFRKMGIRDKAFVSWCGLRGAVPIIFAIMALAADIPHAGIIFNIVFFCTLVSLVVQGTSLSMMAKWLGVLEEPDPLKSPKHFDIELPEDVKSEVSEIEINENILKHGKKLMHLGMPENTLVIMVKRNDSFFVPTGKSDLQLHDKLLVITDNKATLSETYARLNIPKQDEEQELEQAEVKNDDVATAETNDKQE
ncbi:MAG: potassium/proton antiporter [Bacteroidales bacterium]|nr:potassium/proton antiporter [Bacteroidales bacterium]